MGGCIGSSQQGPLLGLPEHHEVLQALSPTFPISGQDFLLRQGHFFSPYILQLFSEFWLYMGGDARAGAPSTHYNPLIPHGRPVSSSFLCWGNWSQPSQYRDDDPKKSKLNFCYGKHSFVFLPDKRKLRISFISNIVSQNKWQKYFYSNFNNSASNWFHNFKGLYNKQEREISCLKTCSVR